MKLARYKSKGKTVFMMIFFIPVPIKICKNAEQAKVLAEDKNA